MKLDDRARQASQDVRRAIGGIGTDSASGSAHGFHRARLARERNQRIGAGLLALAIGAIGIAIVVRALPASPGPEPAVPNSGVGSILYGRLDERLQQARWFTVSPDGSNLRDLGVTATCAVWFPGGTEILITNDAAVGPGHPLRPAVIGPDGSRLRLLNATRNPYLNLGCGDVSPDGTRIALEGFGHRGRRPFNGIYSVRASDGGGLVRLLRGPFLPRGTRPMAVG